MSQVIIVGSGLSVLSAAYTVLKRGRNVLFLDKNSFFGGNSTNATSDINGALTKIQIGGCVGTENPGMTMKWDVVVHGRQTSCWTGLDEPRFVLGEASAAGRT
ncbi:hypothetical protein C2G38_2153794 [Gigaspora rosea]|uniref:FAD-dependent oxidoreductase 2 FAD-binding domain-containing protein n=1 Tax=Gigaspora rosea TaxID=44941 RepID=A0A397W7F6_9GLOM|nr:hypothetical protein C2G38_2153794 [Gigaspora rosea]